MKKIVETVNRTLFELEVGILIYGVICQLFVFLPKDKAGYSIGLWIGVLTAVLMAFHMAFSLNIAVEMDVKGAQTAATRHNIIRYAAVVIVLGVLMVTRASSESLSLVMHTQSSNSLSLCLRIRISFILAFLHSCVFANSHLYPSFVL